MSQSHRLISALVEHLSANGSASVDLLETHISWVLISGEFAYKIKKPVKLDFLDFSSLEQRHFYCTEELRLNRRLAPNLYLEVIPVSAPVDRPSLSGTGEIIEYAVKMRSFAQSQLLDQMLPAGKCHAGQIDQLARLIADFHLTCPRSASGTEYGSLAVIQRFALANFDVIKNLPDSHIPPDRLTSLRNWTVVSLERLAPFFKFRQSKGFVRECHGDLHLGNLIEWEGRIVPFDSLEFSPELRWIDILNEIAFTLMDLTHRGRPDFAARFLSQYLELTGDHEGLNVLRFYMVYRAMVRAHVNAIRAMQLEPTSPEFEKAANDTRSYFNLAEQLAQPAPPQLRITYGVSGSGKTTGSQQWLEAHNAIRIRSDIERKRLFGVSFNDRPTETQSAAMYSADASTQVYSRLQELAGSILQAGYSVIIDATFLRQSDRERFRLFADRANVKFGILVFDAPVEELRRRVSQRLSSGTDASDATPAILERQLATRELLTPSEQDLAIRVSQS